MSVIIAKSVKLTRRVYLLLLVAGISASASVIAYATVSQVFPVVTVPSLTFATHQNCSTPSVQNAPPAGAGTQITNCLSGTSQVAAFTVNRDGSSTPTFSITHDSGILTTSLGIAADGTGCGSNVTPLASGTAVSFSGAGAYIYCLAYTASSAGGTINQFTVNWST